MTADLNEIRQRLRDIELEQQQLTQGAAANILSRDARTLNAQYELRMEALRHEQKQLRGQLPPEGMASGQRLVVARCLGEIRLGDWDTPAVVSAGPIDEWDWSEE